MAEKTLKERTDFIKAQIKEETSDVKSAIDSLNVMKFLK